MTHFAVHNKVSMCTQIDYVIQFPIWVDYASTTSTRGNLKWILVLAECVRHEYSSGTRVTSTRQARVLLTSTLV